MKVSSPALLETVFALKRNFAQGCSPSRKVFSGIEVAPFRGDAAAAVCISSDFEMSWAWRGRGPAFAEQRGIQERQNVPMILGLLEQYSIPITWATVGHLFLESCSRSASGLAHDCMPRPVLNERWNGDWYMQDPCTDVSRDPLWYAPDLVQQILECKTPQEIGTHTFSHINFSARCSTSELISRELEACNEAMRPFGLTSRSLVFPHNIAEYSYLQLLADSGITVVRHRDDNVRLSYPERTASGVYKIYESMNLRAAKRYDYVEKAKIFVEKAMKRRAAYSLWFHPSDSFDVFDNEFRRILRYIDSERKAGRLWVATMGELAAYCDAREQLQLEVRRDKDILNITTRGSLDSKYQTDISLLIPCSSNPKSGWFETVRGERMPLSWRVVSTDGSPRLLVTIPTSTTAVQVTF